MSVFFFFKEKTAYDRRISDWSSDVCSSDLAPPALGRRDLQPPSQAAGSLEAGGTSRHPSPVATGQMSPSGKVRNAVNEPPWLTSTSSRGSRGTHCSDSASAEAGTKKATQKATARRRRMESSYAVDCWI